MNPNNYATLEASRRLYEARIVLDGTDMHWIKERDGSFSLILSDVHYDGNEEYPAPPLNGRGVEGVAAVSRRR